MALTDSPRLQFEQVVCTIPAPCVFAIDPHCVVLKEEPGGHNSIRRAGW